VRTLVAVVLLAVSPAALWKGLTRETNSHAAAHRGAQQYATKRYEEAARSYATASQLAPTPRASFNLGTAQIAAGQRTEGAATIAAAMKDAALKEPALYNRGNSALAANAYEHAIRDYTDALRLDPKDAAAKRNLEIALRKKQQQQQQQQQRQQSGGGQGQKPQQQPPQPAPGQKNEQQGKGGEQDVESLLRSVQQQEQEELARMKRARGESKAVGW
jgi:Ca-activated chloride channel homolog